MEKEKKYLDVGQLPAMLENALTKSFDDIKDLSLQIYHRTLGTMKQVECASRQWFTDDEKHIHPQTLSNVNISFGYTIINSLLSTVSELAFNLELIPIIAGKERMDAVVTRIIEAQIHVMKEEKKQEEPKGSVH